MSRDVDKYSKVPDRTGRNCLLVLLGAAFFVALLLVGYPALARAIATAVEGGVTEESKAGPFFWLTAVASALPAFGLLADAVFAGSAKVKTVREGVVFSLMLGLSLTWPMFLLGTQYGHVSTVRLAGREGVSIAGAEFLQNAAETAFVASFIALISWFVIAWLGSRLSRCWRLRIGVAMFGIMTTAFILVGRNVGAKYF